MQLHPDGGNKDEKDNIDDPELDVLLTERAETGAARHDMANMVGYSSADVQFGVGKQVRRAANVRREEEALQMRKDLRDEKARRREEEDDEQ